MLFDTIAVVQHLFTRPLYYSMKTLSLLHLPNTNTTINLVMKVNEIIIIIMQYHLTIFHYHYVSTIYTGIVACVTHSTLSSDILFV